MRHTRQVCGGIRKGPETGVTGPFTVKQVLLERQITW